MELQLQQLANNKDVHENYTSIEHALDGYIESNISSIKRIKTKLEKKDILGDWSVRWGINRFNYEVEPGLYAVGNPNERSPILVTANYKLTFDKLRKELSNLNLWIMVLDTKGINVWCAAGKGTFGTAEIIHRIKETRLSEVVRHKVLILPQLGAPGVSAHEITKYTGFRVMYGPIKAEDIPEFLNNRYKATKEMRKVRFDFMDRLVLTPLETIQNIKYFPLVILLFLILNFLGEENKELLHLFNVSLINSVPFLAAILIGTVLIPMLLPVIPFRSFALKGTVLGVLWSMIVINFSTEFLYSNTMIASIGNILVLTSITTYLGLNFTGSSTYTSFSGTVKETLWTVPIVSLSSLIGVVLLFVDKIF